MNAAGSGYRRTRILVLVTAAGSSSRFGAGKKEFEKIGERSVLDRSVSAFLAVPGLCALVLTTQAGQEEATLDSLSDTTRNLLSALPYALVPGGKTRRDSVRNGLEALAQLVPEALEAAGSGRGGGLQDGNADADGCRHKDKEGAREADWVVLIHDGARPWVDAPLIARVVEGLTRYGACIPLVPLSDTPKEISPEGLIVAHPERARYGNAQTPQGFRFPRILEVHQTALADGADCTDDAELWARYEGSVGWVPGSPDNRKITFKADLPDTARMPDRENQKKPRSPAALGEEDEPFSRLRIGHGWDLHRLIPGRALLLGSVPIDSPLGEEAHSDGDVLWHAIIDALLGACALGDIGALFPPEDMTYKDADSGRLAAHVVQKLHQAGFAPLQIDCTVVLQSPRIGPYRTAIRDSVARILGLKAHKVSVKAKTKEGVDATGELRAIEATAVVLVQSLM